ncbi:MAG: hypothetical protein KDB79_13885 [Acidobacteria bacterium]|nr:hypothetical protein [Acidobacteriota bacterium]
MKISNYFKAFGSFVILVLAACQVISQSKPDRKISDYLKELPKQYKTYEGDISEPTPESTFIDEKNGYAAYLNVPNGPTDEVYFEMAMFRPDNGAPTVVVSNYKYDFVCFSYDTFFLQVKAGQWIDVKSRVLPELTEEMFFVDEESYKYYKEQKKKFGDRVGGLAMHFYPPRMGTSMDVRLELCDWVDDSIKEGEANNFLTVSDALKTLVLNWKKNKGRFEVAPDEE